LVKARIEQVTRTDNRVKYHAVIDTADGQYRTVLEYDHEPTRGEVQSDIEKWVKDVLSKKSGIAAGDVFEVPVK
jgi:hypothetical protein